jgi:hypothetical protein
MTALERQMAADAIALSKEHADEAADLRRHLASRNEEVTELRVTLAGRDAELHRRRAELDAVRRFSLDMAQIICPRCQCDAYPDSLGEALDWALGHECEEEQAMDTTTRLRGHGLFAEGKPFRVVGDVRGEWIAVAVGRTGRGRCSCGERSPILESDAERKRWHREHKQQVREQEAGQ